MVSVSVQIHTYTEKTNKDDSEWSMAKPLFKAPAVVIFVDAVCCSIEEKSLHLVLNLTSNL